MPELIPFRAEHMLRFSNRDNVQQNMTMHRHKESLGPAYTAMHEGRIIACSGIMIIWPGVGVAWCAFSDEFPQHRIWVTGHVRRVLRDTIRIFKLHRVEAVTIADIDRNAEWIEALGFTREKDIAQKYTSDGRDAIRYEYIPAS